MTNPYLEKAASLGEKDYHHAMAEANEHRTSKGKKALDPTDPKYKQMFVNHRGVAGRVVGTLVGTPLAPIGWVGGYYAGKSHDNRAARSSFAETLKSME